MEGVAMKNILVAVDDTRGSLPVIDTMISLFPCVKPETVILLHVQKIEGRSLMDDMLLSESEIATLKESLKETEYQAEMDNKAEKVVDYFKKRLEEAGITGIRTVIRAGHPAEEILNVAKGEGVNMIIIGTRGQRLHNIFMGSVSREVANNADVPVLVAR